MHKVAVSTFVALLAVAMLIHVPPAHSQEENAGPCSLTSFDPDVIAVMIYYLQRRTSKKLSESIEFTQRVLRQEEESKRRQLVFVTQSLKNYFSGILMIAGLMNHYLVDAKTYEDVPHTISSKQDYMVQMANHSSDALSLATHILDPVLTEQIRRFISTIERTRPESGVGKGFPRYDAIKKEIASITAKLDACVGTENEILK